MKILCRKSIRSSSSVITDQKISARTWSELIRKLKFEAGIEVDSADSRQYNNFITGYSGDQEYEVEVTKYSDGQYEVMFDNIVPVNSGNVIDKYSGLTKRAKSELRSVMGNALDQVLDQNPGADFMFCLDNVIGLVEDNVMRYSQRYSKETVEAIRSESRAFKELASQFVEENFN